MEIILDCNNFAAGDATHQSIFLEPLIRESRLGLREGHPRGMSVKDLHRIFVDENGDREEVPTAETRKDVASRGATFLLKLASDVLQNSHDDSFQSDDKHILLVSHGGFIRVFLSSVCSLGASVDTINNSSISEIEVWLKKQRKDQHSALDIDDIFFKAVSINDTLHLFREAGAQEGGHPSLMSMSAW
jgi:broad specificity phosphatase PhoE